MFSSATPISNDKKFSSLKPLVLRAIHDGNCAELKNLIIQNPNLSCTAFFRRQCLYSACKAKDLTAVSLILGYFSSKTWSKHFDRWPLLWQGIMAFDNLPIFHQVFTGKISEPLLLTLVNYRKLYRNPQIGLFLRQKFGLDLGASTLVAPPSSEWVEHRDSFQFNLISGWFRTALALPDESHCAQIITELLASPLVATDPSILRNHVVALWSAALDQQNLQAVQRLFSFSALCLAPSDFNILRVAMCYPCSDEIFTFLSSQPQLCENFRHAWQTAPFYELSATSQVLARLQTLHISWGADELNGVNWLASHYPDAPAPEQTAMVEWIAQHYPQWLPVSITSLAPVSGAPALPFLASLTPEQIALATKIVMDEAIDHPLETKGPSVSRLHL